MNEGKITTNPYENVFFSTIMSSLLMLLSSQQLAKDYQLMGLKLIRKIVEVENPTCVTPAADWDSDDWMMNAK